MCVSTSTMQENSTNLCLSLVFRVRPLPRRDISCGATHAPRFSFPPAHEPLILPKTREKQRERAPFLDVPCPGVCGGGRERWNRINVCIYLCLSGDDCFSFRYVLLSLPYDFLRPIATIVSAYHERAWCVHLPQSHRYYYTWCQVVPQQSIFWCGAAVR